MGINADRFAHTLFARSTIRRLFLATVIGFFSAGATAQDADGDLVPDSLDNCTLVANADQRDTDTDGIGNVCDADLNQDCTINFVDISLFGSVFLGSDPDADFNGDGAVNFVDYVVLTSSFLSIPGPSGVANLCSSGDALTLSGATGPEPIDGGAVSVVVDQTQAGGSVVVFNGVTNADGTFEVELTGLNNSDFVTVAVIGLGGQTGIALTSLAGDAGTLTAAGGNDGTVGSDDVSALNVSALTTAFSVLAAEAQGSDITSMAQLEQIEPRVDSSTLLHLATSLTAIITDPAVSLPAGVSDTLSFSADAAVRQSFLDRLVTEQASEFDAAFTSTLESSADTFLGEVPSGSWHTTYIGNLLTNGTVVELQFGTANSVTYVGSGAGSALWDIGADGILDVDFASPLQTTESEIQIEDPDNPGNFIQATQRSFLTQFSLLRVREGLAADHVVMSFSGFSNFPDYPQLGDTPTSTPFNVGLARVMFDESASFPFTPLALAGSGLAVDYFHQNNQSEGTLVDEFGFDTLDFEGDGTGSTRRRGFAFDWEILATGELSVVFANGDAARYRRLMSGEDQTHIGNLYYNLAGTGEKLNRTYFVPRDEAAGFDTASLLDRSFRSALATTNTFTTSGLRVFDFVFSDAGVACRNPDSPFSTWTWSIVDGRMELFRQLSEFSPAFFSRTWQPLRIAGNRYWVVETLQTSFDGSDPVVDASVTPGRLNRYTFEHDNSADSRPVLNDDAYTTSVDTPIIIYVEDLLANDIDADGDEIIYRTVSGGSAGGSLDVQAFFNTNQYAWLYTPPAGFTGVETFVYEASDIACRGDLPTPSAVISITVN